MNQYDTERIRESLVNGHASGGLTPFAVVEDFESADVCVVNTCTVTEEADKDARRLLRRITRRNPAAQLVVTGCLASRDPEALRREFPAARVVGNAAKDEIPALLGCSTVAPGFGISSFHGRSRAFVKVQDGCNMHCTYCIIPSVRPELSCKPWPDLEAEVRGLLGSGYREVVLCGVRLGRYLVWHEDRRIDLPGLIERLLDLPGDFRIRLSSLEITDLTDRMIRLLAESSGRFCPSLHLPLQSGSYAVLKRMQRWYSADFYRRRIQALRAQVPDAGLFTDVMHGFPGETDGEFEATAGFLREIGFSGLHVFRYSRRDGTRAAAAESQVPPEEKDRRAALLHGLDRDFRERFAARAVGSRRRVLLEGPGEGLTDHFLKVRLTDTQSPSPALRASSPVGRGNGDGRAASPVGRGNGDGRAASPVGRGMTIANGAGVLRWAEITGTAGPEGLGNLV